MQLFANRVVGASPWRTLRGSGTRIASRHEGCREQRKHQLSMLIGPGLPRLQNAPLGPRVRHALANDLGGEADGVAGEHRLQPAQIAKTGRRAPHRDRLAARRRLLHQALRVCDHQLHADRADMPAGGGKTAEQRVAALFLAQVEALRIEFRGEALDRIGGKGEGADLAPLPDLHVLEEPHQRDSSAGERRPTMIGEVISHSATPAALRAVLLKVTMPVSGRLFETRASITSTSSIKSSPGRNGASQRTSLTPGEPSEAVRVMKPSHSMRIMSEQRCQPEPDSPLSMDLAAAASSRCIGCGSYSLAKARMSSRVTCCGPKLPKRPGGKSSKVSVVIQSGAMESFWGIVVTKTDCGRTFGRSQSRLPAWPMA